MLKIGIISSVMMVTVTEGLNLNAEAEAHSSLFGLDNGSNDDMGLDESEPEP